MINVCVQYTTTGIHFPHELKDFSGTVKLANNVHGLGCIFFYFFIIVRLGCIKSSLSSALLNMIFITM